MSEVQIRELKNTDADLLGNLLESLSPQTESFFHPYPLTRDSAFQFAKREDIFCLVAEINGEIIGYTWWEPRVEDIPTVGICISDKYQGKGIGKKLLEKLIDEAKRQNKMGLRLTVMKDNNKAISLYKKLGFYIIGEADDPWGPSWKMLLPLRPPRKIFIVPYCHPDWAWTHTRLWHERRYDLVFNEVLDIMRKHPHFRWYLDNYLCQLTPFLKRSPERFNELRDRIREGKIAVCGGFANIRPNMVGEETYIRNLILGKGKFKELFPEADLSVHADAVDVAMGHPQMPQILNLAGYSYFVFWRPEVALNHKEIPYEFIWEGLDGSRIISHRACYGGLCFKEMVPDDFREKWNEVVKIWWEKEIGYRSLFSPTGLIWISHGNDDARPLRALFTDEKIDLISFLDEWNKREDIPMVFATPLEYFKELEKEELPIIKGTLDPCDVCYNAAFAGSYGLWKLRLETDKELTLAESLGAIAKIIGEPVDTSLLINLWENLLNYSAHATQWLFQKDFDDLYNLALRTINTASDIKTKALKAICRHIPDRNSNKAIVFNPSPYPGEVIVPILLSFPDKIPSSFSLQDEEGKEIPYQVIREVGLPGWELEVVTRLSLPPMGYKTVKVKSGLAPSFNLEGVYPEIEWKESEFVGIKNDIGDFTIVDEEGFGTLKLFKVDVSADLHIGDILETRKVEWKEFKQIFSGPLCKGYLRKGNIYAHEIEQVIMLYSDEGRIDFETAINWRGEDGFIAFVIPLPFEGELYGNTPFAVEKKDLNKEVYGIIEGSSANVERWRKGAFYAKSFLDWSNGEKGIAYISHDGDRYYILDAEDRKIYHILINSVITCDGWEKDINYQRKGIGLHRFKSSLLFHKGDWKTGRIFQQDFLLRHPPLVLFGDEIEKEERKPLLPDAYSFLALEPDNLIMTSFYEQDGIFFLRFYETMGKEVEARIKLPFEV
ncbi:GNAT family N-acetyltransferase, partial [bacterium]|nr:GNAT family N-acetyltransferase [bacterium]